MAGSSQQTAMEHDPREVGLTGVDFSPAIRVLRPGGRLLPAAREPTTCPAG